MKIIFRCWITLLALVFACFPKITVSETRQTLTPAPAFVDLLTEEEKSWLRSHKVIPIGVDGNYPPLDFFDEKGQHRGVTADYLNLFEQQLGVDFVPTTEQSFKRMLDRVRSGELKAGATVAYTEDRAKDLLFTSSFMDLRKVIIASRDYPAVNSLADLAGNDVAVEDGFITMQQMAAEYPDINLLSFDSTLEALKAVSWNKAEFYVGNQSVVSWLMRRHQLSNLRIISDAGLPSAPQSFVVSKADESWAPLASILQKALKSVPQRDQIAIEQRWVFSRAQETGTSLSSIALTDDERRWIRANPRIKVANDEGWPPYNFASQGEAQGYSIDLIKLVAEKVGLEVEFINGPPWNELYQMGKAGEVDVFPAIFYHPEREEFLEFTRPYLNVPQVMVVRSDSDITQIEGLGRDSVFAGVEGNITTSLIKEVYPRVSVLELPSLHESLRAVSFGQADALVGPSLPISHVMQKMAIPGLKIVNEAALDPRLRAELHVGVRKDSPILRRILQKGMDNISPEEVNKLVEKWVVPVDVFDTVERESGLKWWLIATIVALFVVLIMTAILLSRIFFQENLINSFGSKRFRIPFLLAVFVVVTLVVLLISITLDQNKKQMLESIEVNLGVTLQNTVERLDSWAADRQGRLKRIAQDPEFVELSKALLTQRHDAVSLQATLARVKMTRFLVERQTDWSSGEIFILNRENISVLAPEGYAIGGANFIATARPDLIARALKGFSVFIPQVLAEPVNSGPTPENPAMSFFAVPVIDGDGDVIAVLAQSLSTDDAFMRILRHGRIGSSGESYALDAKGKLLSESRFRQHLIDAGLVGPEQFEFNRVEIRDPGGDLTQGYAATIPRAAQPLTKMAKDVIRMSKEDLGHGRSPLVTDLSQYRDYRGVAVYGAWIWDFNLGVGVTTEIDVNEAMIGHRWLSIGLISTAVVLMVLFVFAMVFTLALGEKVMLALRRSRDDLEDRVRERTQQLRESELKYRSLFELSEDAIVTIAHNEFIDCNRAALTMFGYRSKEDLLSLDPIDLAPLTQPDGRDSMKAGFEHFEVAAKQGSHLIEWTNKRKTGDLFPTEVLITFMRIQGGAFYQVTIRDISNRKALEEEQRGLLEQADAANRAKSDFLANMSHEIRTPMNAIIGLGHLLYRTEMDSQQTDYVKKIQSSAHSLLGIIDDILDFSKIEAGQLKIEIIEFSLDDVLGNLATLATTRIGERPIEFIYNIASDIPPRLVGDPFRLGQILTNLVTNAIKFTERGNIILRVSEEHINNDYTLLFEVEDNGIGISAANLEHLFDPFTQADGSTTRRYGGTGLGLSICKQLTEMMGGTIHVESEEGQGSRFYFYLPFRRGEAIQLPVPDPDLRGMKVLLVDDNPTAVKILSQTLSSLSFEVDIAYSGGEALRKLERTSSYDIILLDWLMPGMDGIETTRRIKADGRIKHVPIIIMMTAYGREAADRNIDRTALDGFLVKPVTPSQLFDAIIQAKRSSKKGDRLSRTPQEMQSPLSGRVLLAEDNEINQQVAVEILQKMGLEVRVCDNGLEAVESVKTSHPDLILMDIQMPEMDGYEATREIRKLKGMSSVPIFAMTANAMAGDEEKSKNAGMDGHITKPVDPIQLYDVLKKWLPESPTTQQVLTTPIETREENPLPPTLPGIDTEQGVKRVGGNAQLYRKLLHDFLKNYRESPQMLRNWLEQDDMESAYRLAHTLGGVAANVGAARFAEAAVKIEQTLRKGENTARSSLENFNSAAIEMFDGLAAFFADASDDLTSEEGGDEPSLSDLLEALSSGDPNCKTLFDQTQTALRKIVPESNIVELRQEIEDFEFDSAAEILQRIMEKSA